MVNNRNFSTNGLTDTEIKVLDSLDGRWLKKEKCDMETLSKICFEEMGFKKGDPELPAILKAYEYWRWVPKPYVRHSLTNPISLLSIISSGQKILIDKRNGGYEIIKDRDVNLPSDSDNLNLMSDDYTLEILPGGRLYLKQQSFISNRFIAYVS